MCKSLRTTPEGMFLWKVNSFLIHWYIFLCDIEEKSSHTSVMSFILGLLRDTVAGTKVSETRETNQTYTYESSTSSVGSYVCQCPSRLGCILSFPFVSILYLRKPKGMSSCFLNTVSGKKMQIEQLLQLKWENKVVWTSGLSVISS